MFMWHMTPCSEEIVDIYGCMMCVVRECDAEHYDVRSKRMWCRRL
jgi:hypothetical protein